MAISNELRRLVDPYNECCCEYCLSNKCKEWAYKKGYILTPWKRDGEWYGCEVRDITSEDIVMINGKTYTRSKLEPEAIFLACEYILNNIKQ